MDAERIATIRDRIYRGKHSHINELCDALVAAQAELASERHGRADSDGWATQFRAERDALQAENTQRIDGFARLHEDYSATLEERNELRRERDALQAENTRAQMEWQNVFVDLREERDRLASQVTDLTEQLDWVTYRFEQSLARIPIEDATECIVGSRSLLARLTPTEEPPETVRTIDRWYDATEESS